MGYREVRGACLDIYIRGYVKKNGRFPLPSELVTSEAKVEIELKN